MLIPTDFRNQSQTMLLVLLRILFAHACNHCVTYVTCDVLLAEMCMIWVMKKIVRIPTDFS